MLLKWRKLLILALWVQDKCKWTGYGQPLNYGQHMDKKTGFVHTLSIRMFVVHVRNILECRHLSDTMSYRKPFAQRCTSLCRSLATFIARVCIIYLWWTKPKTFETSAGWVTFTVAEAAQGLSLSATPHQSASGRRGARGHCMRDKLRAPQKPAGQGAVSTNFALREHLSRFHACPELFPHFVLSIRMQIWLRQDHPFWRHRRRAVRSEIVEYTSQQPGRNLRPCLEPLRMHGQ